MNNLKHSLLFCTIILCGFFYGCDSSNPPVGENSTDPTATTANVDSATAETSEVVEASEAEGFSEAYWVDQKAIDNLGAGHIFVYFDKTSYINDEPLWQTFDGGNIVEEFVLIEQKDGTYKHPKEEDKFYEFEDEEVTITHSGMVKGRVKIDAIRVKE